MIALIVALLAQDFSSPQKTLAAYTEARETFAASYSLDLFAEFDRISRDAQKSNSTDALVARREKAAAVPAPPQAKLLSHSIVDQTSSGAAIVLIVEEKHKVRRQNPKTRQDEDVEEARRKRLEFVKSGDRWLIQREMDGCPACKGRGTCSWCDGAGEMTGKPCPRCMGKKTCHVCKGTLWHERSFQSLAPLGIIDDYKPRADLTSPRGTAEAFADTLIDEQIRVAKLLRRIYEAGQSIIKTYFVESQGKASIEALVNAVATGTQALREYAPKVLELNETGDTAVAVVTGPPGPLGPVPDRRLLLRKSGGKWLVDDVYSKCDDCSASGVCPGCKLKRQMQCVQCDGSRKCRACTGSGWEQDTK